MTWCEKSLNGWGKLFLRWNRSGDIQIRRHIIGEFLKIKHKRERQINEGAN